MRYSLLALFILFVATSASFGQGRARQYTTPLAGQTVLSEVEDKYNAQVYSLEMPDPDEGPDQVALRKVKEHIASLYPHQRQAIGYKTTSVLKPIVTKGFIGDSLPGVPPDSYYAVSNNDSGVSVINSSISVFDAKNGKMIKRKTLMGFAKVYLLNTIDDDRYDPKVVYDPVADRFICIMLDQTNSHNYIIMGFSNTNSPAGKWYFYKFYGNYSGDTTWFDFPQITITQNEVFFTGNKIKFDSTWQAGFKQTVIYQVKKQDGYNGAAALNYQVWDSIGYNGKALRCLYPVNGGSSIKGPDQYFLSNRDFDISNDSVFLVKVQDTLGSIGNKVTVTPVAYTGVNYGVPPDARQPDTAYRLATNDGRVLGAFAEGSEIQFVSPTLIPATGSSGIYLGKIANYTSTAPTMTAQVFTVDTLDFGYPNISYTGNGSGSSQSIISFNYSGPHTYPGMGAVFYDGSNFSGMVNIVSGDSSIEVLGKGENRWGDYMGSQPVWNAIGNVWVMGIYGRYDHNYGNYIAELTSPYATVVPQVHIPNNAAGIVYPNPAWQFIHLQFEVEKEETINFIVYNAQGNVVDKILSTHCAAGKNIIQFNIAPFAPGTYFLKATDGNGTMITSHSFIKQ